MGGHSLTTRSSAALLGSNGSSIEATAKRVAVLLFHFSQGKRYFCEIEQFDQANGKTDALGCQPARFDSDAAALLWLALADAERESQAGRALLFEILLNTRRSILMESELDEIAGMTLPMPSEENPRQDAGMEGGL